ncbi:YigZ family protein [Lactobacillus paragasseri]|uniref:YigZ family protein n=1 Tax=Lactobacillus paragasseri TaxID=2107999 RepID=UPI0012E0CAB8|nr:YigZ family protein [Lactobacillus paragasseri]MDK8086846.1 YigZ family protein [Lactobacillus paragasseri]MDX5118622.1 YigZ family protein [Lactobacillus paragasseri]MDX5122660.1 YigZ family protein [Lactobacillus paragasseri]QGT98045.1 YigZ family protein [Lactobacillus paragasseri]UWI47469.1 YigZ family protein [Lactobacillus paragasseri]
MSSKPLNYLTIGKTGQHELIIKKSKFICSLARTETVEEAQEFIDQISKKYHDATHNTYAYTLGLNDNQVKASDNGEPSGTAGIPELKALQLMKLKNVTAVVTRYFGGIKLGAGGLIRAYSNSVTEAAQNIGVVKCVMQQLIQFSIPYNRIDEINHYLEVNRISIASQEYTTNVTIQIYLDLDQIQKVEDSLINLLSGKVEFNKLDQRFNEIPVTDFNFHEQ